jgi:hypothetical protein
MVGCILADHTAKEDPAAAAVVCLAAGLSQKPVIERAKILGLFVIGVDRDPSAAAGSLCDHMIQLSTHDPAPLIQELKNGPFSNQITAVLNRSSGPPVVTTAAINDAFGLPGVPLPRARQCVNKDLMRDECRRQNVSVIEHQVIESFSDLKPENISLPIVMKPALSMVGKQGVMVVRQTGQLKNAFAAAKAASVTGKVLVEDYLPGRDVSVIAFVNRGRLEILAMLDEINQAHDDGSVSGRAMAVPSRFYGQPEAEGIVELAHRVVGVFELEHSPLLLSCRINEGHQPMLMEIHLDMGGDKILDVLLPAAGDFDALDHMIQASAIQKKLEISPAWNPTAVLFEEGAGLISNRAHRILHAATVKDLENSMTEAIGKVSRP